VLTDSVSTLFFAVETSRKRQLLLGVLKFSVIFFDFGVANEPQNHSNNGQARADAVNYNLERVQIEKRLGIAVYQKGDDDKNKGNASNNRSNKVVMVALRFLLPAFGFEFFECHVYTSLLFLLRLVSKNHRKKVFSAGDGA
jgi:hypothetical protein